MIDLYLQLKFYLDYFPEKPEYFEFGKPTRLTFWVTVLNIVGVIP